jgi:hypothetical protein
MSAPTIITIVELIVLMLWTYVLYSGIDVEKTTVKGTIWFEVDNDVNAAGTSRHDFTKAEQDRVNAFMSSSTKTVYLLGLWSVLAIPIHLVAWFVGMIVSLIN